MRNLLKNLSHWLGEQPYPSYPDLNRQITIIFLVFVSISIVPFSDHPFYCLVWSTLAGIYFYSLTDSKHNGDKLLLWLSAWFVFLVGLSFISAVNITLLSCLMPSMILMGYLYRGIFGATMGSIYVVFGLLIFWLRTYDESQQFYVWLGACLVGLFFSIVLLFHKQLKRSISARTYKTDTLLRIVSHDVSNSLMIVTGLTEALLENKDLDERTKFGLRKIEKASSNIENIIERVKAIQIMKTEDASECLQAVLVVDVLEDLSSIFETRLNKKGIGFDYEIADLETKVIAEPTTFLNDVLCNLVSNSIKFSEPGGHIKIRVFPKGDKVAIVVEDQGVGMSPQVISELFHRFKVKSRKGTMGEMGTGFGLPITKFLVESYGGCISVESRDKDMGQTSRGTVFTLLLDSVEEANEVSLAG
ncbi:MAG: HAMP domain-containing histidine kinase [Pseudobacteriovorax sp.]|nr:HAMP domain-containing histidine kinase [Pseudobacteriovorax sp.]